MSMSSTTDSRDLKARFRSVRLVAVAIALVGIVISSAGCRQDMHNQPKYIPLRPVDQLGSISDGRSARPVVDGTVAQGELRDDVEFYTGKTAGGSAGAQGQSQPPAPAQGGPAGQTQSQPAAAGAPQQTYQGFVTEFPMQITAADLNRGQQRFNIYCAVCHGQLGNGDGMIVRRGFRKPPSYHEERLRNAPVGYFFDVVTNGFGTMPDYASQVEPADRWRIIAYIRALQLSQHSTLADVPADKRDELNRKPGTGEAGSHQGER